MAEIGENNGNVNTKKRKFPPRYVPGMNSLEDYSPTISERHDCGYAPKGFDCNSIETGPCGKRRKIYCSECSFHLLFGFH